MTETTYRFLNYEMHVSAQKLMRNSVAVPIRPKTLATLAFLLANRNEIVSKDEILDSIWPDADVQDQAVFQSISELRGLFKGHDCIQTVRGSGYRWILPVEPHEGPVSPRSLQWPRMIAACLVVLVGSTMWWLVAEDSKSFTVIVHAAEFVTETPGNSIVTLSSIDRMLVQQLGRMGWDSQPFHSGARTANQVEIAIDLAPVDTGISLHFQLRGRFTEQSGHIQSATPLGAIRDLATELHGILSLIAEQESNGLPINQLFTKAKYHMDRENYPLAQAYLIVALTELPNQRTLQRALAYTFVQMGRYDDALELASAIHNSANKENTRVERMMSSIMLSQLLLHKGNVEESKRFAYEALDLATKLNDLLIVAEAQEQLGEISLLRGNISIGREQLSVALKYFSTFCPTGESRVARRLLDLES